MHEYGKGASLFGYTKLYGQVPGGQAEYLRAPFGNTIPIEVPEGTPDDRFLFLSNVLPTAWQAVEHAGIPDGGTAVVLGLGPVGEMASRVAHHRGHRVIAVDLVPERLERARACGVVTVDLREHQDDLPDYLRELTDGRGPDSVVDAVGMEAHGSTTANAAIQLTTFLPDKLAGKMMEKAGVDRLQRAAGRHRHRAPRRHDLAQRGLRRRG